MKIRSIFSSLAFFVTLHVAGAIQAQIEEVVVTAEFREANVQDVPLSITAVDAFMMEARNQTNIFEVGAQAPNVTLNPTNVEGGPAMLAFIRGVGQTDFNYALEPGVGFYVDEVYYPTLTGTLVQLLDLDRVEILRGPQGTLAGRNSIGGSIKLFSRRPGEGGGRMDLTVGELDRLDFSGAMDFTLIEDKLFARVTGVSRSRDGHVRRLDYGCMHPDSGVPTVLTGDINGCKLGTEGGIDAKAGRLSLLWVVNEGLEVNLVYDRNKEDSEAAAGTMLQVNEQLNRGNGAGSGTFMLAPAATGNFVETIDGQNRIYYDNRFVTHGEYREDQRVNSPYVSYSTYLDPNPATDTRPYSPGSVPPVNQLDQQGVAGIVDWQINPDLSLKSISAWREYDAGWAYDGDVSPIQGELLFQRLEHEQWSQELRLSGLAFDGLMDYTLGFFHFDQDGTLEARVNLYYAQLNFIHGPDPTPSDSTAFFAHTSLHLNENTNLALGLRHSRDEKDYVYYRRNPDASAPPACTVPGPPFLLDNPANCALFGFSGERASFKDSREDWRVALDHRLNDDLMIYGQVSTGYKAGGINPRPFFVDQIEAVEPEELISYELGFKSYMLGRRVLLNGAVFQNDYTDIQLQQTTCEVPFPPFVGGPCLQPGNAGDAEVRGIELETQVGLGGLSLDASISYLDFEHTEVAENVAVTRDMTAPYTPEIQASLGAQYRHELAEGILTWRLDWIYQDDIYAHPVNAPRNLIESYELLNGRVSWSSRDERWQVILQGNNLTDKVHYHSIFDQWGNTGSVIGKPGLPRTFAVTIRHNIDY